MKYVDMNEVVFDPASLAFPGLGNCHGVVYVNEYGMFGYHAAGNPLDSRGKAEAFGMFVRSHSQGGGAGLCLYGACPTNRHAKDADHKAELKMIAAALKFAGKIKGWRWDMAALGWATTYVAFQFNQTAVSVWMENFTNGQAQAGNNANWPDHKYVSQIKSGPGQQDIKFAKLAVRETVTTTVVRNGVPQLVQPWTL